MSPSQDVLESFCNLGYASGCEWTPSERMSDAVRFSVLSSNGKNPQRDAKDADHAGRTVYVTYVFERDHRPVEHGQLTFNVQCGAWSVRHSDPRIQKMAECYLDSYMKRRG